MGPSDCARIQAHLDECGPCLREYELDQALKTVVKRSCGCEPAPVELRTTILRRLTMVHLEMGDRATSRLPTSTGGPAPRGDRAVVVVP